MHTDAAQADPAKLRALASWYRNLAEQAGNPAIWEARLRSAEKLEAEADLVDRLDTRHNRKPEVKPMEHQLS
jgi:hypothetical protein